MFVRTPLHTHNTSVRVYSSAHTQHKCSCVFVCTHTVCRVGGVGQLSTLCCTPKITDVLSVSDGSPGLGRGYDRQYVSKLPQDRELHVVVGSGTHRHVRCGCDVLSPTVHLCTEKRDATFVLPSTSSVFCCQMLLVSLVQNWSLSLQHWLWPGTKFTGSIAMPTARLPRNTS